MSAVLTVEFSDRNHRVFRQRDTAHIDPVPQSAPLSKNIFSAQ